LVYVAENQMMYHCAAPRLFHRCRCRRRRRRRRRHYLIYDDYSATIQYLMTMMTTAYMIQVHIQQ
jgi:hypothetical protein